MKFQKLYSLIAEKKSSFEDLVKDFFGGSPEQVEPSEKESKENIFAAIFKDGDNHLKILMKRDGGDVCVKVKTAAGKKTKDFKNTDEARKTLRSMTGKKIEIDYRLASQKDSAINSRKESEDE